MAKKLNHLDSFEYVGEFWCPNLKSKSFPGVLKYTPETGITLKSIQVNRNIDLTESSKIFGVAENLGKVTLLEPVQKTGVNMYSQVSIIQSTYMFLLLIKGMHLKSDSVFNRATFSYSKLNEFCFPQSRKSSDKFDKEEVFSCTVTDKVESDTKLCLLLKKGASGPFIPRNPSDVFVFQNGNESIKDEINTYIKEALSKKNGHVFVKNEITYYFEIVPKLKKTIKLTSVYKIINDLKSVLKLLTLDFNICPEIVTIYDSRKDFQYEVLNSTFLTSDALIKIKSGGSDTRSYNWMPVNVDAVKTDVNTVINSLLDFLNLKTDIICTTLLNHLSSRIDSIQHFILLLSAFQQWGIQEKIKVKNNKKYDWMIDQYSNTKIREEFQSLIPSKKSISVGQFLSDLRNTIVHPRGAEDRKYIKKIFDSALIANINEYLFLILYIALLKKIGIKSSTVDNIYQRYEYYISKTNNYTLSSY